MIDLSVKFCFELLILTIYIPEKRTKCEQRFCLFIMHGSIFLYYSHKQLSFVNSIKMSDLVWLDATTCPRP